MKLILAVVAGLLMCVPARAQLVTVSASGLADSSGNLISNATIYFAPMLSNGSPASYRRGAGLGQTTVSRVSALVTHGAFSLNLADTSQTSPANICYSATVINNVSGASLLGPGYGCVQPTSAAGSSWCSGSVCNFDWYTPNLAPLVAVTAGPQGAVGPIGPTGPPGGSLSYPGVTSNGANGLSVAGSIMSPSVVGFGSAFPINTRLIVEGSSISVPFNSAGDAYISASSPGSGYAGSGTVAVSVASGSCTVMPAVNAFVGSSGGLTFSQSAAGLCAQPTTFNAVVTGFTGGSGASVTVTQYPNPYSNPWFVQLESLPTLKNRVTDTQRKAVSGSTILDAYNRFSSDGIPALCADTAHTNYYMIDGGSFGNSLSGNNVSTLPTYDVIFSQWIALLGLIHSAGCHAIVATPLLRGTGFNLSNYQTYMSQAALLAPLVAASVQSGDYVLDWYHDLANLQAFPFPQGDQVHPTGAGQQYVAMVADNELAHGNAYQNGPFVAGGYLTNGFSMSGNSQLYQNDGDALGYLSGYEYETITGHTTGSTNGKITRACDTTIPAICNTLYSSDSAGNFSTGGSVTANGGMAALGNLTTYAANAWFVGNNAGTEYMTVTGPTTSTLNPFIVRQTHSDGSGGVNTISGDATGRVTFPAGVTVSAGGFVVYRCTTAGTLPVGGLTTTASNCGASTATALTVN